MTGTPKKPQSDPELRAEKRVAFVAVLAECCQVGKACAAVGIGRTTAYRWREEDLDFADAWDAAMKIGVSALEDEAHRRAFDGVDEPVFYQGGQVDTVRKYSDTLAIFLLKAHNPTKYRENTRMELTGAEGGPVQFSETDRAAKLAALVAAAQQRAKAAETEPDEDPAAGLV